MKESEFNDRLFFGIMIMIAFLGFLGGFLCGSKKEEESWQRAAIKAGVLSIDEEGEYVLRK